MADNASPARVTTPSPDTLGDVRAGVAALVITVAVLLLILGGVYLVYATTLGGTTEGPAETWNAGFARKHVWPVAVWSLGSGVAGLVLAFQLLGTPKSGDSPTAFCRQLAILSLAGAVSAACVPIYLLIIQGGFQLATTPFFFWATLVCAALLIGGLIAISEAPRADGARVRMLLVWVGVGLGAATFLLGIALAVVTFSEQFTGGLATWRQNPRVLIGPVAAYLAGLALVFFAIQPAAPLVRKDQNIRRVVFGANLAIVSLLLIGVLVLPNILATSDTLSPYFSRSYDWTTSGVHSLSEKTRTYLGNLREPVKVTVLLPEGHPVRNDMVTMLDNMRSVNNGLTYELIDTRLGANLQKRLALMEQYKFTDTNGVLVKTGKEDGKGDYTFIKDRDLADQNREQFGRRAGPAYSFKGEAALLSALLTLSEGQMKIYFTSGHGEYVLDGAPPMPMPGMKQPRGGGDLNSLRMKLADRESVKVDSLKIDRTLKEIPKDASVVVIARPRTPFAPEEVKLLRDYLRRERKTRTEKAKDKGDMEREVEEVTTGKLFILLDTITQREGGKTTVTPTGLESLMTDYGVKVGNDRILQITRANPDVVLAITDDESPNPVAKAFNPEGRRPTLFPFNNARTVAPAPERKGGGVDPLMLVLDQQMIWSETDFDVDAQKLAATLRNDAKLRQKMLARDPLCMAVAVSDRGAPPGMPMDAAHAPAMKDTPRMVVFGSSSWITDEGLRGGDGPDRTALFTSCISWLHDRTVTGGSDIPNKERQVYNINIAPEQKWRLLFVPTGLMALAVLIGGLGVWVIRRR